MTKSRERKERPEPSQERLSELAEREKCLHEYTLTTPHAKLVGGDTYCRICGEEVVK